MSQKYQVVYEATPNPQSMRFVIGAQISTENAFFDDPTKTARSPLAQKIFGFPWAKAIMIGQDSVTITKQEWVDWSVLADPLSDLIVEHLESEEGVLLELHDVSAEEALALTQDSANAVLDSDSDEIKTIKELLNKEIRPAVAMDGGDIIFVRYEQNRLYLKMQGACSGCPSSTITLKQGIETRMKEAIPGLLEVLSI